MTGLVGSYMIQDASPILGGAAGGGGRLHVLGERGTIVGEGPPDELDVDEDVKGVHLSA